LVNHDGLAAVTKIVFHFTMQLADSDRTPAFRDAARNETGSTPAAMEQPATPQAPRYGLPFRVEAGEPPRFIVTALNPGSPAERSCITPGDRLLEFQLQPIDDEARFCLQLLADRCHATI